MLDDRTRLEVFTLTRDLVPPLIRRPRFLAYLDALLAPLRQLNDQLVAYARAARRTLGYSSQTLAFEGLLNDQFDPILRRIRIVNTDTNLQPHFFNLFAEAQPPRFVRTAAEVAVGTGSRVFLLLEREYAGQVGFLVLVPSALLPSDPATATSWKTRLEAVIRRWKYATIKHSTRYVVNPAGVVVPNPNTPPQD